RAQGLDGRRRFEPDADRADRVAAVEGRLRRAQVDPGLAVVGVAGLEVADDGPVRAAQAQGVPQGRAGELAGEAGADDHLALARLEGAAGGDAQLRADRERGRLDAAQGDV